MDIKTLAKIVKNRARIARQWHRLNDPEVVQFVAEHPDVETPEAMSAATRDVIKQIITTDDPNRLRKIFGDDVVDAVLMVAGNIFGNADHDHD